MFPRAVLLTALAAMSMAGADSPPIRVLFVGNRNDGEARPIWIIFGIHHLS